MQLMMRNVAAALALSWSLRKKLGILKFNSPFPFSAEVERLLFMGKDILKHREVNLAMHVLNFFSFLKEY